MHETIIIYCANYLLVAKLEINKMSQERENHTIETGPATVSQNCNASSTHKVSFSTTQIEAVAS